MVFLDYLTVNDIKCSEGCFLKPVVSLIHGPLSNQTWKCYSKIRGVFIRTGCIQPSPKFPIPITQILEVLTNTCSVELSFGVRLKNKHGIEVLYFI